MMKGIRALPIFVLLLLSLVPVVTAGTELSYYLYRVEVTAREDGSATVLETIEYSGYLWPLTLQKTIPTANVGEIAVRDDVGPITFSARREDNSTVLTFSTRQARGRYTLYISYTLYGWVRFAGGSCSVSFWRIKSFDLDCRTFSISVTGPPGFYPFLSNPRSTPDYRDPPSFSYSTSIPRGGSFDGFLAFFSGRTFYLLSVEYTISPEDVAGLEFDMIFLNPDLGWQFSSIVSVDPLPSKVYFDGDGNLRGVFRLGSPAGNVSVNVRFLFDVSVHDPTIGPESVGSVTDLLDELQPFLLPTEDWPCRDPAIRDAAARIAGSETNAFRLASAIMEFVTDSLSYEKQHLRLGPRRALELGLGDCSEYTDVFVSLARAAGLPARGLYGWAFTSENILPSPHAFAEVYLPGAGWQPLDPSWGDMNGDYFCRVDASHLVRCVRGRESSESWASVRYSAGRARVSERISDVKILQRQEAAQFYRISAGTHLVLASRHGDGGWLSLAENLFGQARDVTDPDDVIRLSRLSIAASNEGIRSAHGVDLWPIIERAILLATLVLLPAILVKRYISRGRKRRYRGGTWRKTSPTRTTCPTTSRVWSRGSGSWSGRKGSSRPAASGWKGR